jgi:hypothetical protein
VIVPPQLEKSQKSDASPVDWNAVIREAGFEPANWTAATPQWIPPTYADTRAAWNGTVEEFSGTPMRIEAAAYRGRPVYFELIAPWTRAESMQPYQQTTGEKSCSRIPDHDVGPGDVWRSAAGAAKLEFRARRPARRVAAGFIHFRRSRV